MPEAQLWESPAYHSPHFYEDSPVLILGWTRLHEGGALGTGHLGVYRSSGVVSHIPVLALSFVALVMRSWLWLNLWGREGLPDQKSPGSMASKSVTRLLSVYLPGLRGPSVTWASTMASPRGWNLESGDK